MNPKLKRWLVWLVQFPVLYGLFLVLTVGVYSFFVDSSDEINPWVALILPLVLSIYFCKRKITKMKEQMPEELEQKKADKAGIEELLTGDKLEKKQEQPSSDEDLHEKKLKFAIRKSWFTYFPAYYAFFQIPLALIYAIFADFENITDIWISIVFGLPLLLGISVNRYHISELKEEEKKRKQREEKARKKALDKERTRRERLERDKEEKQNLVKMKDELKALQLEINTVNDAFVEKKRKEYAAIIDKVHQEQEVVKALKARHPSISEFISSRGVDDMDSKVFIELKEIFQNSSPKS